MSLANGKAWVGAIPALMLACGPVMASPDQIAALKQMSVDELLDVEVTLVSRREEGLRNAAAAIAVLRDEDLRRSGATSIPEALRLVPGLHVARQSSNAWAVSSRGFSSINSEKLLVLSDTRSIYTPLFSGVHWAVQDYLLRDVERVEVVRGPGAALWGSNAVNGVINITTRNARDTHGQYLEAGFGGFEGHWFGARHGGETADGTHYRVYGRFHDHDTSNTNVVGTDDRWRLAQAGFRTDWEAGAVDSFTIQGDIFTSKIGQLEPAVVVIDREGPMPPYHQETRGGNVLARWKRRHADDAETQLRAYYDFTDRDDPSFDDTLHTFDVDLQQRFTPGERHEITWGAAYRFMANRNRAGAVWAIVPERSEDHLVSGFVQDRIRVASDVDLTVGTKLEHNDFSGFEVQPSVRATWAISPTRTIWGAVSRAVRVPTRLERDVFIDLGDPGDGSRLVFAGNPDFDSERLVAYEAGFRWQPRIDLAFDLALYHNEYDRLASLEIGTPYVDAGSGVTIIPIVHRNLTRGHSRGAELLAEWQPTEHWRLVAAYSAIELELDPRGDDINRGEWIEGSTPRGQFLLRSQLSLGDVEIDAQFRHHSRIRRIPVDASGAGIGAYSSLDLRVGWQPRDTFRLSLVGQNLLDDEHEEFGGVLSRGALPRAAYLKAEWWAE